MSLYFRWTSVSISLDYRWIVIRFPLDMSITFSPLDDSSSRKFVKHRMLRAAGLLEGHIAKLSFLLDWAFIDSTHEDIDDDGNGDGNSTNPGESNSTTRPPQGTTVKEKRAVRMSDFDDLFQATWVAEVRSHLALFSPCSLQASFVAAHQRDEVAP